MAVTVRSISDHLASELSALLARAETELEAGDYAPLTCAQLFARAWRSRLPPPVPKAADWPSAIALAMEHGILLDLVIQAETAYLVPECLGNEVIQRQLMDTRVALCEALLAGAARVSITRCKWVESRDKLESVLAGLATRHDLQLGPRQARAAPALEVLLTGEYSTGKSTLINAWLNRNVLPTAHHPTTACETRLKWAEGGERVDIYYYNDGEFRDVVRSLCQPALAELRRLALTEAAPLFDVDASRSERGWKGVYEDLVRGFRLVSDANASTDVRKSIVMAGAHAATAARLGDQLFPMEGCESTAIEALGAIRLPAPPVDIVATPLMERDMDRVASRAYLVKRIDVHVSAPMLKDGIVLVDSPGPGSGIELHGRRTHQLIDRASAIVVLRQAGRTRSPAVDAIFDCLRARKDKPPIVLCLTHADQTERDFVASQVAAFSTEARNVGVTSAQSRAIAALQVCALMERTQLPEQCAHAPYYLERFLEFREDVEGGLSLQYEDAYRLDDLQVTGDRIEAVSNALVMRLASLRAPSTSPRNEAIGRLAALLPSVETVKLADFDSRIAEALAAQLAHLDVESPVQELHRRLRAEGHGRLDHGFARQLEVFAVEDAIREWLERALPGCWAATSDKLAAVWTAEFEQWLRAAREFAANAGLQVFTKVPRPSFPAWGEVEHRVDAAGGPGLTASSGALGTKDRPPPALTLFATAVVDSARAQAADPATLARYMQASARSRLSAGWPHPWGGEDTLRTSVVVQLRSLLSASADQYCDACWHTVTDARGNLSRLLHEAQEETDKRLEKAKLIEAALEDVAMLAAARDRLALGEGYAALS